MAIQLADYQIEALHKMKNGCILCGGVGSGKSRTSLAYYYLQNGGDMESIRGRDYSTMCENPQDLYIITTAKKRDSLEWEAEFPQFLFNKDRDISIYNHNIVVDSWNNISKYKSVQNAFFIFDEQRVVGSGQWVKSFLKITKKNQWILLSATPGDTWSDYIPVFIANGFYKTKTEFNNDHIIFARFVSYPKIDRFINTGRLIRLRNSILITMDFERKTVRHKETIYVDYDTAKYKELIRSRWNPWEDRPIESPSEFCYSLRKIVNSDPSRVHALLDLIVDHPKSIIFYNFDYELDIIKKACSNLQVKDEPPLIEIAEWNGHKHQPIPTSDSWVYLVQYLAGAEGWNCISTDTVIFYSQNYSYKVVEQASGRIDRMNTPFIELHYYHLKSRSGIDIAIGKTLSEKKKFNEMKYVSERKLL